MGGDSRHQQSQESGRRSARTESTNWTPRWRRPSKSTTRPTPNWSRPRRPREENEEKLAVVEADLEEARARLSRPGGRDLQGRPPWHARHPGRLRLLLRSHQPAQPNGAAQQARQPTGGQQVTAYQEEVTTRKAELARQMEDQRALHRRGCGCRAEGRESARRQEEGSQGQGSPDSPTREGRGGAPGGTRGRGQEGRRRGAEGARGRRGAAEGGHHDHSAARPTTTQQRRAATRIRPAQHRRASAPPRPSIRPPRTTSKTTTTEAPSSGGDDR